MPTLTIDNLTITVPEGTNVLQAAEQLGIVIPHFCYHAALGAVGACRLCAMTFVDGPVKGVQMSCMVEAKDGMVVSTSEAQAQEQRAHVIEWLMMNHPHDCPVCDEGGQCQLQDMTIAGGHGLRRYGGKKRTFRNQDLGPFVIQEMNRCIQCYRCVRTYQDYCGGTDFGVMGSRQRLFFGRFQDGCLESPFSGNLVDVCPTGTFTDKTFRYRSRVWDLEEAPSICPHCSLGCATIPGARYGELQRVRAGVNPHTNGFFLCDRGRFGYGHANHPQRRRRPRLDGGEVSWKKALAALEDRLAAIRRIHGPDSILYVGSARASLEANTLFGQWAGRQGGRRLVYEVHPQRDRAARHTAALLGDHARSLADIRQADFVLTLGCDPIGEGPLLALAIRQAVRAGGLAASIDPRPVDLCCPAAHLPMPPQRLLEVLAALRTRDFSRFARQEASFLEGIASRLERAQRPVIAAGADLLGGDGVRALFRTLAAFSPTDRSCGAFVLLGGPNSYGGALLSQGEDTFDHHLNAMLNGSVRAMVCLETDPFSEYPDPARAGAALSRLEYLAVFDSLPTVASRHADLLLPTRVTAEGEGIFVNNEGRPQAFEPVFSASLPLRETGQGQHPPREFTEPGPDEQPRQAWAILADLLGLKDSLTALRPQLAAQNPLFAALGERPGERLSAPAGAEAENTAQPLECVPENALTLLPVESLFGSELLASLSPPLQLRDTDPYVLLHSEDAKERGLREGERVRLSSSLGQFSLTLRLSARMARGIAIVPRQRGSGIELLVPGGPRQYGWLETEQGGQP